MHYLQLLVLYICTTFSYKLYTCTYVDQLHVVPHLKNLKKYMWKFEANGQLLIISLNIK